MHHLRLRLAALLLALLALLPREAAAQPNETNRIHMQAKPAVVRIYAGYIGEFVNRKGEGVRIPALGSGSGFLINQAGYILTNAHVVGDIKEGDDAARTKLTRMLVIRTLRAANAEINERNFGIALGILEKDGTRLTNLKRIAQVFLQSGKSYPFEIKAFGAPTGEGKDLESGKDVSVIKIEVRNAPTLRLGTSSAVNVGDHVWVMGYPGAADSDNLDMQSELEPTTNDGSISAKKATKDGTPVLQTNTNTTHGNSGGPVLNKNGEAIGLLTFRGNTVNGQEVQGFNFIVPIDTANEFVRQAGTDNKLSAVDEKWQSGLKHYWKQEYSLAEKDFRDITALFPDHRESTRLITDCHEHIAKGEDKSGAGAASALVIGGVVVVGGAAVVVVAFLVFGKKSRPQVPAYAGGYGAPPAPAAPGAGYGPPGYAPAPAYGHGHAGPPAAAGYGPPAAVGYGPPGAPGYGPPPPAQQPAHASQPAFAATALAPALSPSGKGGRTEVFQAMPEATLRFVTGPLAGKLVPVGAGAVIGREAPAAQVVVQDPQVSSVHAWIGLRGSSVVFVDRGSTNGSFVNDRQVSPNQEIELRNGDVVALGKSGNVKFQVQLS